MLKILTLKQTLKHSENYNTTQFVLLSDLHSKIRYSRLLDGVESCQKSI